MRDLMREQELRSIDDAFRVRVVWLFSLALVIWAPIYSFIMYELAPHWEVVASTMGVMILVGISPLLVRFRVPLFVVGNWLAFNVFWEMLFVGAYAGYGPPPFYWLAVVPMLALVISGVRSGLFWLLASLFSLWAYYEHLHATGAEGLVLSPTSQLIFEGSVLAGLYALVMLLSLSYERAKNLAVAELKASEEWGRRIVENAADAILTVDAGGIIYSANEACAEIFGYSSDEITGRRFDLLVPAAGQLPPLPSAEDDEVPLVVHDPQATVERCTALRAWAGQLYEALGARADGQPVAVEVAIERLNWERDERFVVVMRDLTYRKKVEEQRKRALEESRESFRALIENLPEGFIVHRRGVLKYLNPAAGEMLRYKDWNNLVGSPMSKLMPDQELEQIHALADPHDEARELTQLQERRFLTCHGDEIPVELVTFEAMFQDEKSLISIVRDLTETRKMRLQMMQMERMSAVGTLAAGVAHEINNPLTFVRGNLEYVDEEVRRLAKRRQGPHVNHSVREEFQKWRTALQDAQEGAERIRKIVTDLHTYSQQRETEVELIDIEDVVETSIRMAYGELKHRARLVRDFHHVGPVLGDPAELGQVVLNLLINAAHAIPEGRVDENEVCVGLRQENDQIIIEVSDTGEGIPDHVLPRIFDPFFTTKSTDQGTGLGLAICRNIIQRLHGELSVETAPGLGTTFWATLPVAQAATTRAGEDVAEIEEVDEFPEHRPRVLIIDDEPMIREVLKRRLSNEYLVEAVHRTSEALARLESGATYDIILCDIMMPEQTGMDFYECLEKDYPELRDRIIFITGGAVTQKAAEFLKEHESVVLTKPFRPGELRSQIKARLHA